MASSLQRNRVPSPLSFATNKSLPPQPPSTVSPSPRSSSHPSSSVEVAPSPSILPAVRVLVHEEGASSPRTPSTGTASTSDMYNPLRAHEDKCGVVRLAHLQGEDSDPAFEMLVLGCGGGPLETNLSSYLCKPYSTRWSDGCTLLEGGSTMGALSTLVEANPFSFIGFNLGIGVDLHEQQAEEARVEKALKSRKGPPEPARIGVGREGGGRAAGKIWEMIRCFAITHAHLDHIQGLIISSGASLQPRPLYGTHRTLDNIERIFDGGIWPKLAGYENDGVTVGRAYLYRDVPAPTHEPLPLSPSLSFHAFPLSHGMDPSFFHRKPPALPPPPPAESPATLPNGQPAPTPKPECYDSTAFFVRESISGKGKEFLFFGDVEPDSISKRPLNHIIWQEAAPKIVENKLNVIFLECSYPTSQPSDKLWGHLSPPYMFEELLVLSKLVEEVRISAGWSPIDARKLPLAGVTIVIIHIKDDILSLPSPSSTPTAASSRHSSPPASPTRSGAGSPRRTSSNGPPPSASSSARRSLIPNSPLTMSPPQPSIPLRRASGSGIAGGANMWARRKSMDVSGMTWDAGRRASVPWNIQLGAGAGPFGAVSPGQGAASSSPGSPTRRLGSPLSLSPSPLPPASSYMEAGGGVSPRTLEAGNGGAATDRMSVLSLDSESIAEEGETEEETVHERIERELNEIEEGKRTGVRFLRAEQGMRMVF
ncbi:cAMP phosphodiesterases class-II-domain-containing protein [Leucosporidium creatinivorum]|uniref:cAMP phosphodiesterases class-II-domain-containing protein n=1 Tax=Leucosporidium creatinivorum TaxID=106004 RepID=A0A1Y2E6A8_9BASI|nr:cAMP phosphodiesterases class-II-domain-containing protein [Leucosporidium creatinivorum]